MPAVPETALCRGVPTIASDEARSSRLSARPLGDLGRGQFRWTMTGTQLGPWLGRPARGKTLNKHVEPTAFYK